LKLKLYSDSEHSYLKVPRSLLRTLKISKIISNYSYQDSPDDTSFIYCEDESDIGVVIAKLDEENFAYSIEQEDFNDIICSGILVPWVCQYEFYDRDLDWNEEQDPDFLLKVSFDEPLQ
jgi:hypothetical protein